jgi:DNA-directed RNA polymerase subunit RPC12/RpoP
MVIQFLCPNGHRIHCGDDRAGKAAKCPRCGVKFLVPDPSEAHAPVAAAGGAAGHTSDVLPVKTEAVLGSGTEPPIEFLCPTGHQLRSPANLQGQPGQCPACGSRFYIPSHDEPKQPQSSEPSESSAIRVHEGRPEGEPNVPSDSQVPLALRMAETDQAPSNATLHPMASLFAQLWARKSYGTAIELHLSDGQSVVPDHYSRQGSQDEYGIFATREPDDSFTLIAVAWSSVHRVTMRGLKQLPEELRGQ